MIATLQATITKLTKQKQDLYASRKRLVSFVRTERKRFTACDLELDEAQAELAELREENKRLAELLDAALDWNWLEERKTWPDVMGLLFQDCQAALTTARAKEKRL